MTEKRSLSQDEITTHRKLSRRAMTLLGGATLGAASAFGLVGCCFGAMGGGGCSDRDPTDGLGRGVHCVTTGCSDNDPSDPMNGGRNCTATGCSDSDPNDPAGGGRSCGGTPVTPPTPTPGAAPAPAPGTTPT